MKYRGLDLYIFSQSPGGYQVQKFGRQIEILIANFLGGRRGVGWGWKAHLSFKATTL
jgi:hypothetical protein